MISQTAEYALRAMVYLAIKDAGATGEEIAEATKVPRGYLAKVLKELSREKLLNSQRGIGGGFILSREASKISILDVINAVDPIERLVSCPLELESHALVLCPLHKRLSAATAQVEKAFAESSLSELVAEAKAPECSSFPLRNSAQCRHLCAE